MTSVKPDTRISDEGRCEFTPCSEPVAYAVLTEHEPTEWLMCAGHCAEMRENDPLEYIVAIRSVRSFGGLR